jgi:hypothetical protein
MTKRITKSAGKASDKDRRRSRATSKQQRNLAEDPASTLLLANAAILAGSYIVRRAVEKGLLHGRYGGDAAQELLASKNIGQTVVAMGLAKLATRSLPGAVIVSGGAVAKALYDRRQAKRKKQRKATKARVAAPLPDEQP